MKRTTFIILMFFITNISYSQTKGNEKINQIKIFFQKNSLVPNKTFYYNKAEKILEFSGNQFPLMDIKVVYQFNDEFEIFNATYANSNSSGTFTPLMATIKVSAGDKVIETYVYQAKAIGEITEPITKTLNIGDYK